jgi:hypothetical protein
MNKNIILAVVLLFAGQLYAAQESQLITVSADGTKTTYVLSDMQRIVFASNTMTVNMKSGNNVVDIISVRFLAGTTGVETLKPESSVFVFPNPVKTNLTVVGIDKSVKINLLNVNGILLQSFLTQSNTADIDVSSLPQGLYLLQVEEQVIKFAKQ